jgi:hypothetical protein
MAKKGSKKQEIFIAVYKGNIEEAADIAGLSYGHCRNLMTKPDIVQQIKDRSQGEHAPLIATRQRRQEFWTETMENAQGEMRDRLTASKLLGQSEADFTEKVEHSGSLNVTIEKGDAECL